MPVIKDFREGRATRSYPNIHTLLGPTWGKAPMDTKMTREKKKLSQRQEYENWLLWNFPQGRGTQKQKRWSHMRNETKIIQDCETEKIGVGACVPRMESGPMSYESSCEFQIISNKETSRSTRPCSEPNPSFEMVSGDVARTGRRVSLSDTGR